MKTKTSINQRTFAFAYVLLVAFVFCGCGEKIKGKHTEMKEDYEIKTIDGCEYIEVSWCVGSQSGYYSLTHKGNCKFCAERSKK